MSEVSIAIAGRNYTVACAEGEESHVASLGQMLNDKLDQLGGSLSSQESQNLLFAGLFVADDVHEAHKKLAEALDEKREADEAHAAQEREANLAIGMREELQLKISQLESELDGLQSAQQRHSLEVDDMRKELGNRRQEAMEANEAKAVMTGRLAVLERELEAASTATETLKEENASLNAKVERLGSMSAVVASNGGKATEGDLAPALERFADLLEDCAEKLERTSTAP